MICTLLHPKLIGKLGEKGAGKAKRQEKKEARIHYNSGTEPRVGIRDAVLGTATQLKNYSANWAKERREETSVQRGGVVIFTSKERWSSLISGCYLTPRIRRGF